MKLEVCDLCRKNSPDAKIKYKYKAKKFFNYVPWLESGGWIKIELCQECLDKIIEGKKKGN